MTTIDKILGELQPYEDKVLINPLSNEEIEQIQSKYKNKLPEYFLDFLRKIGLKQDFIFGINENINDFEDLSDFIQSNNYFRFGKNGGEDYLLLSFNENDNTIYEYDYYCDFEIKSLEKTFDDLLIQSLNNVRSNYKELVFNTLKYWSVQFSIETENGKDLENELGKFLKVKLIKEPEYIETSPAEVECYEGEIEIEEKKVVLSKQTYKYWDKPTLYFDWEESIQKMKINSIIKKIDKSLSNCPFNYDLIDYGIICKKK